MLLPVLKEESVAKMQGASGKSVLGVQRMEGERGGLVFGTVVAVAV